MATLVYSLTGKDAPLVERLARTVCRRQGGNCYGGSTCRSIKACHVSGWSSYVDEMQLVLNTIRETHSIVTKK